MKCYGCDKFLKKGHGENIWYHPNPGDIRRVGVRGEYRYYCHFCLKVKDYRERMNATKWRYTIADASYKYWSGWVIIIFFLLFCFFADKSDIVSIKIVIVIFLIFFPICIVIDYWNYSKTKKKNAVIAKRRAELWRQYEKFKREQWKPLAIEQEWLRKAEIYVKSRHRYPNEWFCHCEKCLEVEWKKRKSPFQNNHA